MILVSHETLEHLYKRMEMMNLAGGNVAVKGKGPLLFGRQFVGRGIAGGAVFNFSDNWLWLGLLGEDGVVSRQRRREWRKRRTREFVVSVRVSSTHKVTTVYNSYNSYYSICIYHLKGQCHEKSCSAEALV